MNNKIKTIKCDYWNHQSLSREVIEIIQSTLIPKDEVGGLCELDCVPKVRKPYFWEFWKWGEYERECRRILNEVEKYCEDAYLRVTENDK